MFQIVRAKKLTDKIFSCEIRTRPIAKAAKPGHFVTVSMNPDHPKLPLPIADFSEKKGTITVVVEADDRPREQMMALDKGDAVFDCRGPFGQRSRIENVGKVVCIGGGIGAGALFSQIREYKSKDVYVVSILGFRSKDRLFWQSQIAKHSDELYITTDDGTYGIKGRATVALRAVLDSARDIERVVSIGSLKLMRACAEITRPHKIPTIVNLGAIMAEEMWRDGHTRIPGESQQSFSFFERTEFDGHRLDLEWLIAQQKRYAEAKEKDA
ncbi:MAG: hypothetical protein GTO51_05350 [Candidatus Latescibacteria bacterium]|nr:hypothetical protein [Candidatus Latescibacterota bacterium]NIO28429.1 hypothetical protein [Candidatus Latescibacterota bacterium]NIO55978.1 hypothetical protein [Candidatus Latescibacterota bacterium]NIT01942.1 hypothetical protein [Candidatus Latescibacterota bacterium]